jgi:GntR family transcriptional regulator
MKLAAFSEWPNSLESFSETAIRMGLVASSVILRAEVSASSLDEAEKLSVAPGSLLFRLDRIRRLDGVPIAVDSSIVSVDVMPGLHRLDFTSSSLYDEFAKAGLDLFHAETTIEARAADPRLAAALGVAIGRPVLEMKQIVRDGGNRALLASTIQYAGDRYRLRTYFDRMDLLSPRA